MDTRLKIRKEIRKRMLEQSTHLSNRTNNFLLANSILIVGTQFKEYTDVHLLLVLAGFLLALLWLIISLQTKAIIKELKIGHQFDNDEVDKLVDAKKYPIGLRATDIIAIYIPLIFLGVWIFNLYLLLMCNSFIK